ncbi:unnamed protein product [Hymenolepis diminuta]|uniref:Uncharacterized protein n=1 Tax=Hymenolepis diminuta TaxID=6216 RepID=A0A564YV44_HYMDI|nr:unnamed protein product [Hymenolepis diminuta]
MKAKHWNLGIAKFVKVARSFVCKARKELLNENNGHELATRKTKEYCQRFADSLRTPEFGLMDKNRGESMRHFAKERMLFIKTSDSNHTFLGEVSLCGQK